MVGIDDLLIAFATAAGKSAGETLVKELLHGITSNLATKEDLAKAVEQIKGYVHQELQAVESKAIIIDVDTAIRNLRQYKNSGQLTDLSEQNTQQLLNRTASEIRSAIWSDANYPWREFVAVARFATVSTTFWSIKALQLQQPEQMPNLVDALIEAVDLLNLCLTKLHEMEDETITVPMGHQERTVREDTRTPHFITHSMNGRAWYVMQRGRYPGGSITSDTGWLIGVKDEWEARQKLDAEYQRNLARINEESLLRQRDIYKPLGDAIAAMNDLLNRLRGPVTAIQASFNK